MRLAPLCCYATDPDTRPDCTLTPVVAFGATRLCASCAARRSTMGKGQRPRPLETPALDVLTWLAAAEHDLRAARHALHAAARRARQRGHSWQVIGDQLGISRQAAQQRFGQDCNQDLLDGLEPWGVLRGRADTTRTCSTSSNSTSSTTTFTNPSSPAHSLAERTPFPSPSIPALDSRNRRRGTACGASGPLRRPRKGHKSRFSIQGAGPLPAPQSAPCTENGPAPGATSAARSCPCIRPHGPVLPNVSPAATRL